MERNGDHSSVDRASAPDGDDRSRASARYRLTLFLRRVTPRVGEETAGQLSWLLAEANPLPWARQLLDPRRQNAVEGFGSVQQPAVLLRTQVWIPEIRRTPPVD